MDKPDAAAPVPHDISQSTDEPFNLAAITFAMGDAPEIALPAALDMQIAPPPNNAIDSNRVFIGGSGPIRSFGQAYPGMVGEYGQPYIVTKKITYQPDPGQTITLQHNPPALTLLGGIDRDITGRSFGEVQSDENGNWEETRFTQDDKSPLKEKSGGLISVVAYMATGTTTITIPPLATRAWIRMYGASGASGAAQSPDGTSFWASAGTGSGGYLEKFLSGLTPGKTLTFTRGAGGVPALGPGGNGGDTILASGTQTIATLTASGSHGTGYGVGSPVPGSLGGTATGGDINHTGQSGGWATVNVPGVGGARGLSRGADGTISTTLGVAGIPGGMIIHWYSDPVE
jgi:hypothetical protein